MSKDATPHHLTDEEIKAIAERRAESLKRIREQNEKKATHEFGGGTKGGGKAPHPAPAKGRSFRHQGR